MLTYELIAKVPEIKADQIIQNSPKTNKKRSYTKKKAKKKKN